MSKPFGGVVNIDIKDSSPTGGRMRSRRARTGRPTCSTSCSTTSASRPWSRYGGLDRDAQHQADRRSGSRLHELPHHRALFADPLVPAHRPQPHDQRHGGHHRDRPRASRTPTAISRSSAPTSPRCSASAAGTPTRWASGTSPPEDEMNLASIQAPVAARPRLRALLRVPGRRDQPVVPRPGL